MSRTKWKRYHIVTNEWLLCMSSFDQIWRRGKRTSQGDGVGAVIDTGRFSFLRFCNNPCHFSWISHVHLPSTHCAIGARYHVTQRRSTGHPLPSPDVPKGNGFRIPVPRVPSLTVRMHHQVPRRKRHHQLWCEAIQKLFNTSSSSRASIFPFCCFCNASSVSCS